MPGYSCSVKERMLYSSCKGPLLDIIESNLGLTVSKKVNLISTEIVLHFLKSCLKQLICVTQKYEFQLEIDAEEKLTEDYLIDEIHPKQVADKPKFEKPKGPPSRGAKRLTKPQKV